MKTSNERMDEIVNAGKKQSRIMINVSKLIKVTKKLMKEG